MANKQAAQRLLILLALALIILTACTPKNRAEAFAISLAAQRRNRIGIDLHRLQMERENALTPVKVEAQANVIWAGQWVIIGVSVALAGTLGYWVFGIARADVRRRQFKATLIPVDPVTRLLPLLPYAGSNGILRIYDPNTGSVLRLDQTSAVDLHLADNATRVRLAGLLPPSDIKLLNER